MNETALLVAQVAVLVLLFGFLWAVVRSSSRTIGRAAPPPMPMDDPVEGRHDTAAHAVVQAERPAPAAAPVEDWLAAPVAVPADPPTIRPAPDPFADHIARAPEPPPPLWIEEEEAAPEPATIRGRTSESTAQVLAAGIEPRLVVEGSPALEDGLVFPLGGGLTIGRSRSNDLHVDDSYVSHMHARILRRGAFYFVEDLGSTNGTYLNDQRVEGGAQLRVRDVLRLGETTLRYEE